jgi:hypothetical protein
MSGVWSVPKEVSIADAITDIAIRNGTVEKPPSPELCRTASPVYLDYVLEFNDLKI